jgi:hypothetical protein
MTFGVTNVINCINQSAIRTDLTALELLQLTGSDCQFDKCAVFSAACQASLPAASCNTGRFVYITSECKYYFSNGSIWTDDVDSQLVSSIYSWGTGNNGSLGDNTTASKLSPVSVVGGFTDWCQVSVGGNGGGSGAAFGNAMMANVSMRIMPRLPYATGCRRRLPSNVWARQPPAKGLLPHAVARRGGWL